MNISLDFDNTYTRDPDGWDTFIKVMRYRGHKVYCVTMRYETEGEIVIKLLESKVDNIFFTDRQAKESLCLMKESELMFGLMIHLHLFFTMQVHK